MMNMNRNEGKLFPQFPKSMKMETLFTHSYALIRLYLYGISWLYKAFTLSVQCKLANCTSVYKATYLKGFQMLLKNSHFAMQN